MTVAAGNHQRVAIFGASGRVGRALVRTCMAGGYHVVAIGRRADALAGLGHEQSVYDFDRPAPAAAILSPGDIVVNAAHARFTAAIAALCPPDIERLVVIGSTRYKTRFPDRAADQVNDAVEFLTRSSLPWTVLHPTMIYGSGGENNVPRIAELIRKFHVVPLPNGGRTLIQPIHGDDVAAAVVAAIERPQTTREVIEIAGPQAVTYKAFVKAIAKAAGSSVLVPPIPVILARGLAAVARMLPGVPPVSDAEIRRLAEDKAVDTGRMTDLLGIHPRRLDAGLAAVLGRSDGKNPVPAPHR